jgi:hypothetical protein
MLRLFGGGATLSLAAIVGLLIDSSAVPHPMAIPILAVALIGCSIGWFMTWQLEKALPPIESQAGSEGDHSPGLNANHNGYGDIVVTQTTHYGHQPQEDPLNSHRGEPLLSISSENLVGFYKHLTSMQADRNVKSFLGKLHREGGTVHNVACLGENRALVTLKDEGRPEISLEFGPGWMERLEELSRGDPIVAIGRLHEVDLNGVRLTDCEIDDLTPRTVLGELGVGSG